MRGARKRIEVIAVGTEVLMGEVPENNTGFLARSLTTVGLRPARITVLPDELSVIAAELERAFVRSGTVIVTGGLGPTMDDVTKEAAISVLGGNTECRPEITEIIRRRFRELGVEMPRAYETQAVVPEGAEILPNPVGAAVGLRVVREGFELFLLPGVPAEMSEMFNAGVLPTIAAGPGSLRRCIRTFGLSETDVEEKMGSVFGTDLREGFSLISGPSGVDIYIPPYASEEGGFARLVNELGSYVYAVQAVGLEEIVLELLKREEKTLSTAESVTGGLLAATIVSVPGASESYLEGFTTYSDGSKVDRLGVDAGVIETAGAVSREVCLQMADGARRVAGSDFAVSTTGIAGPAGGSPDKPVGLCFVGLAAPDLLYCRKLLVGGGRERIRLRVTHAALDQLRLLLCGCSDRLEPFLERG